MVDLERFLAHIVAPPRVSQKYGKYLQAYPFAKIQVASDIRSVFPDAASDGSHVCFITQEYLKSLEDWGTLMPAMQQAQGMGVAMVALLDRDAEAIMLARSFDYGFDEVLCLGSPNHEFASRVRHTLNEVAYKFEIGEREGIDPLTGLLKKSMLSNHLLASKAYARRHNEKLYATMYRLACINGPQTDLTLSQKNRVIQEIASVLRAVCRPYDATFMLSQTQFFVIWSSITDEYIASVSMRLAEQIARKLAVVIQDPRVAVDLYQVPTDSDSPLEKLKPFDSAVITAGTNRKELF